MMLAGKVCSTIAASVVGVGGSGRLGRGARDRHAVAGAHQVHRAQPEEQREGGDDFEIEDRLGADAAHLLDVAAARDAGHQRAEQQRRDDRADQPQKDRAHRPELLGEVGREDAQRHARGHADKDPARSARAVFIVLPI